MAHQVHLYCYCVSSYQIPSAHSNRPHISAIQPTLYPQWLSRGGSEFWRNHYTEECLSYMTADSKGSAKVWGIYSQIFAIFANFQSVCMQCDSSQTPSPIVGFVWWEVTPCHVFQKAWVMVSTILRLLGILAARCILEEWKDCDARRHLRWTNSTCILHPR